MIMKKNTSLMTLLVLFIIIAIGSFIAGSMFIKASDISFNDLEVAFRDNKLSISNQTVNYTKDDSDESVYVNSNDTLDFSDISNIVIETSRGNVNISDSNDKNAYIDFESTSNEDDMPELKVSTSGNTAYIELEERNSGSMFNSSQSMLNISIPGKKYGSVKIRTASSDVKMDEMNCQNFSFHSSSGDLNAVEIIAEKDIEIETASGDVQVMESSSDQFFFDSSSGDFNSQSLMSKSSSFNSASSDMQIDEFTGDLLLNSSSGMSSIKYKEFSNIIDANSVSGNIILHLPEDAQFNYQINSLSGDINIEHASLNSDEKTLSGSVGQSNKLVKINSASGDISILKR